MKEELAQQIIAEYPKAFKDYGGDMRETCLHWGFECGPGWFKILKDLATELKHEDVLETITVDQVKEKFGTIRFYVSFDNLPKGRFDNILHVLGDQFFSTSHIGKILCSIPMIRVYTIGHFFHDMMKSRQYVKKMYKIISKYENMTAHTCESCGEKGKLNPKGWISCLCDPCRTSLTKRREDEFKEHSERKESLAASGIIS
jgi:hypothetical protein